MKNFINCPECNAKLSVSILVSEKQTDRLPPKDGDYNVCVHCHTVSIFENNVTSLRVATEEENSILLKQFDKS